MRIEVGKIAVKFENKRKKSWNIAKIPKSSEQKSKETYKKKKIKKWNIIAYNKTKLKQWVDQKW